MISGKSIYHLVSFSCLDFDFMAVSGKCCFVFYADTALLGGRRQPRGTAQKIVSKRLL